MKFAVLRGNGLIQNTIFNLYSLSNRDNCFHPYYLLREKFKSQGVEINTPDMTKKNCIDFELHMDVQTFAEPSIPCYVLLLENSLVWPENSNLSKLSNYRKIFTWDDNLVDGNRFIKIYLPNPISTCGEYGFASRERFCCLISSNRTLDVEDDRILYQERANVIRWFEKNAPNEFDLYGIDWDIPVVARGLVGRVERRFWRFAAKFISWKPFPSYKGKVLNKSNFLTKTRFAICYENVRDLPGYITEKIFDCFFSGTVPVYWGASNIVDYIPADCFVDRRKFNDTNQLYNYLVSITEYEYIEYQKRISAFLQSNAAYKFSSDFFAETITNTIMSDLALEK